VVRRILGDAADAYLSAQMFPRPGHISSRGSTTHWWPVLTLWLDSSGMIVPSQNGRLVEEASQLRLVRANSAIISMNDLVNNLLQLERDNLNAVTVILNREEATDLSTTAGTSNGCRW
jgi:hypothetical protein